MFKEKYFNDFIKLNRGFDLPNDKIIEGEYPVVASTEIKAFHKSFKVKAPGVVTGRSGSLGTVQYVSTNYWPLNTALYVKDFKGNDPKFVYYFLQTMHLENFNAGAGVPSLNQNHLHKQKIIVPDDVNHQRRIASILSAYDDLIEVNNQRIKLLEETARELYKEWFVRMRFPGHKEVKFVKGVPEGWEEDTCYSFADVKGGGTPSTTNPDYWEGTINFFTPTDHSDSFYIFETEKKITEKGLKNSSTKMFPQYSTFITARGSVGNICLAGENMAMNQSCFGLIPHNNNDCFFTFMFTDLMVSYLKQVASGATFDAITLNTFRNYKAIIPTRELRDVFFEIASPLFYQIETLIQQNTQLRQIRDRLLPRLISGKLEVK